MPCALSTKTQPDSRGLVPGITGEGRVAAPAERRQLTVMFCDLVGSTALSTGMDPEDLRDVIASYQSRCSAAIRRYDGFVAKYMGDGILVYFGYPRAHEDEAERSARAGLDIVDAMAELNAATRRQPGIELDGGQHAQQEEEDAARALEIARRGYRVIRFWNNDVMQNLAGVLEIIRREMDPEQSQQSLSALWGRGRGPLRSNGRVRWARSMLCNPPPHPGPLRPSGAGREIGWSGNRFAKLEHPVAVEAAGG